MAESFGTSGQTLSAGFRIPAQRTNTQENKPSRSKRLATAIGITASALSIVYCVGTFHYSTHFVPRTTVNGVDASGMTTRELAEKLEDVASSYSNHVTGDGFDLTVDASDIDLSINGASLAAEALGKESPFSWPVRLVKGTDLKVDAGVSFNEDELSYLVSDAVWAYNETAEGPTNATVAYDSEKAAFVILPSELGTALDADSVRKAVGRDVLVMHRATTLGEDELLRASVREDDEGLLAASDWANKLCGMTIPLTLDGKTLQTVGPELLSQWISVVEGEGGMEVVVDQDAIFHWSLDNMNSVVNGENETRGWEVSSWDLSCALAPQISSGDSSPLEIPTITTFTRPEESAGHESRGRHVDVNISTQYARLYDTDGKTVLWRSPFVSGNVAMGHGTPYGEYAINSLERDVVLTGLNDGVELKEGEEPKPEDYYNSHVSYWMCFLGTELGLHDADWRWESEFGGDTYLYDGSHGCINLPVDAAGELFGLLHVGDEVYIHD